MALAGATRSLSPTIIKVSSSLLLAAPTRVFAVSQARVCSRPSYACHSLSLFVSSNSVYPHQHHVARSSSGSRNRFTTLVSPSPSSVSVDPPAENSSSSAADAVDVGADLDLLDIRVGKILKAWKHPEADSLYVEEVDVGEPEGPRTICSGLVKYVPQEALEGRTVVVLANLKPRNMRGVKSNGMLLCASDAAHENVELLTPPEGAVPGDRIWFGGEEAQADQKAACTPNQVQKKKIWEGIQPLLKTTSDCTAVFQERTMRVSAGVVTCASLQGGNIS